MFQCRATRLILVLVAFSSAGCATRSANMAIGSDQSYASLADQRAASIAIVQSAQVPQGATVIGRIDASRCHRRFDETPPTDEMVIADLKVSAYAKGADGIADVQIERQSALLKNCWFAVNGAAVAYRR